LNRDFPDQYKSPQNTVESRQKETAVIMNWSSAHNFVLSANLHGGSVCANYPFDSNSMDKNELYSPSPDDALFRELSLSYSLRHATMWRSNVFFAGITNGAAWYILNGGMQDWNYLWTSDFEITIEVSTVKWPPASTLANFWAENKNALLSYMNRVHIGVHGVVLDQDTGIPLDATISVSGTDFKSITTDKTTGDYYRLLLPGRYTIVATADGYQTAQAIADVYSDKPTKIDFHLAAGGAVNIIAEMSSLIILGIFASILGIALVIIGCVWARRRRTQHIALSAL